MMVHATRDSTSVGKPFKMNFGTLVLLNFFMTCLINPRRIITACTIKGKNREYWNLVLSDEAS